MITPALSADEDFRRRFQRESQVAASVRQQNVVTIFQAGEADGLLFVTMELVHGTDLRGLITAARPARPGHHRRDRRARSPPPSTPRTPRGSCTAT